MHGYGDAAQWGEQLARDLGDWRAGLIDWSDVDRGILLAGPPGVGKTVYARALANTCGAELVIASLAKWQAAGYLNDLLKSMRKSFEEARKKAPSILFVDELDAIGSRDMARGDNASYHQQVVNAFLKLVDGAEGWEGVVVIGATNRHRDIDAAITRSGRLERIVEIPLPDEPARIGILEWHSGLKATPTSRFVSDTHGWTGADIEALVRKAKRDARRTRTNLTMEVLEQSLPQREHLTRELQWRVSVHECGHALIGDHLAVGVFLGVKLMRSVPTECGRTSAGHSTFRVHPGPATRQEYLDRIAYILGGMAAEKVIFGDFSDGAGGSSYSDLAHANRIASQMVVAFGMDEFLVAEGSLQDDYLRRARLNPQVWSRIDKLLWQELNRAIAILVGLRVCLLEAATLVMKDGFLTPDDILAIRDGRATRLKSRTRASELVRGSRGK